MPPYEKTAPCTGNGFFSCKPCKPSSVPRPQAKPPSFIYDRSHLRPQATYPPTSGEQPLAVGIHGLATRQTYGRSVSLPPRWALTPPFHPYPCGRLFSVTLLHPHGRQVVSLDVALCCSDFPPPAEAGSDGAGLPPQRYKQSANSTIRQHLFGPAEPKSDRTTGCTPSRRRGWHPHRQKERGLNCLATIKPRLG